MPPLLLAASSLALAWILLPFYGAILWGVIIAMLFAPLFRRLLPHVQQRRTLAAALIMLVVLVIGVLPFALITASLAREASVAYLRIESGEWNPVVFLRGVFDALPAWASALLERAGLADFDTLQARVALGLAQTSQFIATQALSLGLNTFGFVTSLGITLYLAFFLIRDGEALARTAGEAIWLPPANKRVLFEKFVTVVRATVKGSLLVATVQGSLGGLAFWFLGVQAALLWAVLMAFLSLLPAIGTSLVWVPVAVYFLMTGATWKAGLLVVYGIVVHGLVDNLLRPVLVGKDAQLPDYVVMITTLGGMAAFGINGFIIGPAIAAMFIAVWHIFMTAGDPSERP
jgi:predicted PurR-regulated permease PerM